MNLKMEPSSRQRRNGTVLESGTKSPGLITPSSSNQVLVWKTAGEKPHFASLRYRCLLQLPYLKARGWNSLVIFKGETVRDWSRVAALILVKSCRNNDVVLAREAAVAGVPVIFDLTDNLFAEGYGGPRIERLRGNFKDLAKVCSAITVASPAMVEIIRPHLPPDLPVRVIPDPLEAESDTRAVFAGRAWRRDPLGLRHSPPRRALKRVGCDLRDLIKGDLRALRYRLPPPPPPPRLAGRKRIVWFGKSDKHELSGLAALAHVLPALEKVDRRIPIELLVVSDSRRKFDLRIAGASFPTVYREWHPLGVFHCIQSADAVVMPNRSNDFSIPKSANRAVLALSLGLPVVATPSPALEALGEALYSDDWEESLPRALTDSADRRRRAVAGETLVAALYSGQAVAAEWDQVLRTVMAGTPQPYSTPRLDTVYDEDVVVDELLHAPSRG